MKFIHLSDLHLGKRLHEVNLLEDQAYILQQILEITRQEAPQAVVIAGDVYDKSVPSVEAVQLLDSFLSQLAKEEVPTLVLSGNHDYRCNTIGKVRDALPEGTYAIQNDCVRFGDFLFCGSRGWTCPDKGELEPEDKKIYLREAERLRLSFECMSKMRKEGDKVVCLMHFPPFNVRREDSEYTKLIIKYDIDCVVYGHLHGRDCRADLYVNKFGVDFYLTSTDLAGHKLTRIF